MKNCFLVLLCAVLSSNLFAQVTFDPGYFIRNEGDTIHCLIRNQDWRNSPTGFKYSLPNSSEVLDASVETVNEFALDDGFKYVRYDGE